MRAARHASTLTLPVLLLSLTSCAAPTAVAESPVTASPEQISELEGGVTEGEYASAFERFSDCMTASGTDLIAVEKKDYLITFSYSGDAVSDGSYQRCYVAEFEQVDTEWQLASYGASESAKFLRACLESKGVAPVDRAEDLAPQAEKAGIDLKDCSK